MLVVHSFFLLFEQWINWTESQSFPPNNSIEWICWNWIQEQTKCLKYRNDNKSFFNFQKVFDPCGVNLCRVSIGQVLWFISLPRHCPSGRANIIGFVAHWMSHSISHIYPVYIPFKYFTMLYQPINPWKYPGPHPQVQHHGEAPADAQWGLL